jgi:hypothetical protein
MLLFQIIVEPTEPALEPIASGSSNVSAGTIVSLFLGGVVLVTLIGIALYRLSRVFHRPELHGTSREQILQRWQNLEQLSGQGMMGAKLAVIEADKLLDQVLRSLTIPGTTLGERLKAAAYNYPNIHRVWGAHRLRNQLVHDTSFEMGSRQARQALDDFKAALKVLNVM